MEQDLPPFLPRNPGLWLRILEFIFTKHGINTEQERFNLVCIHYGEELKLDQWLQIGSYAVANPFSKLKQKLLDKHRLMRANCLANDVNQTTDVDAAGNDSGGQNIPSANRKLSAVKLDPTTQLASQIENISII